MCIYTCPSNAFFHDIPSLLQKTKQEKSLTKKKNQKNPSKTQQLMNPQKQNTMLLK